MRVFYCIWAALLLAAAPAGAGQAQPAPTTGYMVFLRGVPVGREQVSVRSDANGTTITGTSRLAAPLDVVLEHGEVVYGEDGSPASLTLQATTNGGVPLSLHTTFTSGAAVTQGTQGRQAINVNQPVSPRTIVLANIFFGGYAWLATRLQSASQGTVLPAYVAPVGEVKIKVDGVGAEQMQVGTRTFAVRRFALTIVDSKGEMAASLTTAADGTLLRFTIPVQSVEILREDLATSTARTDVYSNPGDEAVVIPGAGFNIGATITRPTQAAPGAESQRLPAVVLHSGAAANDRDGIVAGVPIMGQLAGALADAGFLVVRYDRRGYGQSGGRSESATLSDYADDLRSVVQWLSDRKDVDPKRIAVVGHGEGAWIAMLAASRDKRIDAVVTLDAPASTGQDFILEQQQHALDLTHATPADRESKVALQKRIASAVITGKGWENVPKDMRRQADTPWFQSLLTFDPAKVLDKVHQPLLVVHGDLDREVPVAHADRVAELAKKHSKSVDVVVVRGINHLLVPAQTGEVSEYGTLTDRTVSHDLTKAVGDWLTKTFAAAK
jgi:pimeloyl-ACP methyl ester carboxylesterase